MSGYFVTILFMQKYGVLKNCLFLVFRLHLELKSIQSSFVCCLIDPSSYKPKLVSTKKIYVYKNKNVGQCKTTSRTLRCFSRKRCVKRHYYYKKQCIKYLVRRYCVIQYTTTCKFCTKWFWRRCYRIRKHYKYIVKCYNSRHYQSCVRRVTKRINRTVLVKKYYITKKYNKKY